MTNILATYTPAETHLILHESNAWVKDLLKFTMMDLVLKQVLVTKEVSRKPHPKDRARLYIYILAGKNYGTYRPLPHEKIFLRAFDKSPSIEILFRHYVIMCVQNARGEKHFVQELMKAAPNLKPLFKSTLLGFLFGTLKLTDQGESIQQELNKTIQYYNDTLPTLIQQDPKVALERIVEIGGNIFLLSNLDFSLLKKFDHALVAEIQRLSTAGKYAPDGWTWFEFEIYLDMFDSVFDAYEAAADNSSGCDSACNSCGGCGGCD